MRSLDYSCYLGSLVGAIVAMGSAANATACLYQPEHCALIFEYFDDHGEIISKEEFSDFFGPIALEHYEQETADQCTTFPKLVEWDVDDKLIVSTRLVSVKGFGVDGLEVRPLVAKIFQPQLPMATSAPQFCSFVLWKELL